MLIKKFFITGCTPCIAVTKVLEELKSEGFKLPEIKETDMSSPKIQWECIEKYNLVNVPTLIFYEDNGEEKGRLEWFISKEQIVDMLENQPNK